MFAPSLTLDQLGWRSFYVQQLTLQDLEAGYPARVCSVHRSGCTALAERGELEIVVPRSTGDALTCVPTVGDWVLVEHEAPRVLRVLERLSLIARLAAGTDQRRQPIAANLDSLFVVTSCNDDFNPSRLERYLAVAADARVEAVIVLTKADLCTDPGRYADEARSVAASIPIVTVNAMQPASVQALEDWLVGGCTVAFVGSSGVGKSTMINTLIGADMQPTRGIREDDAKGRHTTTAREMFALPGGAWVIDTPGMRELRIGAIDAGVREVFDDIGMLARQCRFRDCSHSGDDGCAVAAAVATGQLDSRRLTSYLKLQREAANAARTVRERRERERHWGRVHRFAQRVRRQHKGRDS
jgi:ribosome biogenesis GTPase / thiamine phosphate phosphatase